MLSVNNLEHIIIIISYFMSQCLCLLFYMRKFVIIFEFIDFDGGGKK